MSLLAGIMGVLVAAMAEPSQRPAMAEPKQQPATIK
jgi:hypothetical protein